MPPAIEGNRQMLEWLRGERQWYDDSEQRQKPVQLIDFDTPGANVRQVTWEWTLKPPARKGNRADVMFLVNGIPVAIVENKNPKDKDAIDRGIGQLLRYERETPELLGAAQLFNVTHLLDYWYGVTWNASRRFMARWKELSEETYRFAVQSFFEPADFLRTVVKMVITGNNHSLTRSLAGGRAAPTVQGGSARESRPGTPNGSEFKPPRRNSPPGQPGPDGDHPAGAALQAPVSAAPGSRPSASIRASRASSRVR